MFRCKKGRHDIHPRFGFSLPLFYPLLLFLHLLAPPLSLTSFMVFLRLTCFHEVKLAHTRYLQDASFMLLAYPGMLLSYPGMSLPFPGMSLPSLGMSAPFPTSMPLPFPGMSLPYSGVSIPFSMGRDLTQSHTWSHLHRPHHPPQPRPQQWPPVKPTTFSSSRVHINECTPLDMTAKVNVNLRINVDSMSNGSTFLDSLVGLANELCLLMERCTSHFASNQKTTSCQNCKPNQLVAKLQSPDWMQVLLQQGTLEVS